MTCRSDLPDFVESTLLTPDFVRPNEGGCGAVGSGGGGGRLARCMNFRASFRAAAALRKKSRELEKPPLERRSPIRTPCPL